MKSRLFRVILLIFMIFLCFAFSGCNPERHPEQPKVAGFYGLQTAYENGWLSRTDLKQIAKRERIQ